MVITVLFGDYLAQDSVKDSLYPPIVRVIRWLLNILQDVKYLITTGNHGLTV